MNLKLILLPIIFSCSPLFSMESENPTFDLDQFEQDLKNAGSFAKELHERIAPELYLCDVTLKPDFTLEEKHPSKKNDFLTCMILRARAQTWLENEASTWEDGMAIFQDLLNPDNVQNFKKILFWDMTKTPQDQNSFF